MVDTITNGDVKKAMQRVNTVHNELVRARRQLAEMLNRAKEQGLFLPHVSSGCETDCPSIHAGAD